MGRSKQIKINLTVSFIGQLVNYVGSFVYRTIFVRYLSIDYLGVNGLFSNIILLLSLAELGVGSAITFSLYKPLAERDYDKVKALIQYFGMVYKKVSIAISVIGVLISPVLEVFIKGESSVQPLYLIYFLFLGNTVVSYIYSYKRALFVADQRRYVNDLIDRVFGLIRIAIQIIILIMTGNYVLTLVAQMAITLTANFVINRIANKEYSEILDIPITHFDPSLKMEINKKIRAMFAHKLGSLVVFSTDNILISTFIGLSWVGLYSNYLLIINIVEKFILLFSQSISASIGNLVSTEGLDSSERAFKQLNLLYYWVYSLCAICLYNLLNPFILFWLGESYVIDQHIVFIVVVNFYLNGIRKGVLGFRNSLGLFWNDRYKAIAEALINLVASIILVRILGVSGIFIGTAISTLFTSIWIEPYILFKHFFKKGLGRFYLTMLMQAGLTFLLGLIMNNAIGIIVVGGGGGLFLYLTMNVFLVTGIITIVYGRSDTFRSLVRKGVAIYKK